MTKAQLIKRKKVKKLLKECIPDLIIFIITLLIFRFVLQWGIIPTGSMAPTIQPGSVFFSLRMVDKQNLHRGSIISFQHNGQGYMKRVVGLPGETLHIEGGAILH